MNTELMNNVNTIRKIFIFVYCRIKLNTLGFNVGEADGIFGQATRKGIRNFQYARQLVADGFPDASVFSALGVSSN